MLSFLNACFLPLKYVDNAEAGLTSGPENGQFILRKFFKRYMPDPNKVREHRHLRVFGTLLHDPNLWHLNRRSVSGGLALGLFWAWMPIPTQMLFAAATSIPFRVNLPLAVAAVWLTNPVTIPPMFYFAYKVGAWILGRTPEHFQFELSFQWLLHELEPRMEPFLLGCGILAVISAVLGFSVVRLLWRLHLVSQYKERKRRRNKNI
jgi:uncharacterized protein (DUF2062 family)